MATYGGKHAVSLGLWATYPAERVNGVMVSDRLFMFLFKESAPPPDIVYPGDRERWARDALNRAEKQVDARALRAYLPWLTDADYRQYADSSDPYAHPISALRRILVETDVYTELGRDIQGEHPDLTVVYIQCPTRSGVFAPFAPLASPPFRRPTTRMQPGAEKYFRASTTGW